MKPLRAMLCGLLLFGGARELQAHGFLLPATGYGVYGGGGGFIGFSKFRGASSFHFSVRRSFGPIYGGPSFYAPPVIHGRTYLRVCTPPPIVQLPPPVIRAQPIIQVQAQPDFDRELIEQLFPPRENPPRRALPPPKKVEPAPKPKLQAPPPRQPNLPEDPKERALQAGRKAFSEGKHGSAAEWFLRAIEADPDDPLPHFLLAQARLALSKYRLAYASVLSGLRLRPDWPESDFRPLDLYGENPADYSAHQMLLEAVLADHPDDEMLLFLYAYQLWFDGRRAEARPLLEQVAPTFPEPRLITRFLQAFPNAPAL